MLKRFALSISSGLILGLSWVEITGFFPLVFISLIPFLLLEEDIFTKRLSSAKVYVHAFVIFAIFNAITSWWIYFASPEGVFMAILFGSLLVAFPFWFFHLTRKYIGNKEGYIAFVLYVLAFEWVDYNWPLSHPWLPFGNVFANSTSVVQWYEYTGIEGGSLWVLLVNLLLFFGWKKFTITKSLSSIKSYLLGVGLLVLIPISISFFMLSQVDLGNEKRSIGIVLSQPNINPYTKFDGELTAIDQTKLMLQVTENLIDENTRLILTPETAFPYSLEENMIEYSDEVQLTKNFLKKHPKVSLLTGASTHAYYDKEISSASRKLEGGGYYESYNSTLLINNFDSIQTYHKMKLVLGVEVLPFQFITKPLESMFDLGGTSGTLGTEKAPKNFILGDAVIAPTICYESIYGEFVSEFSRKGANVIAVSTNDAWWYDTPGYKQLLAYTRLRAIENRKWIARSANTGISCFINPKGEIVKKTKWEETTAISMEVPLIEGSTFYAKYGDYISRTSIFISALLLLLTFVRGIKTRKK